MAVLLAGDVGGTKVYLRAFDSVSGDILAEQRYLSTEFSSLTVLVQTFQKQHKINSCQMACLGLPGPVDGRNAKLTNLAWTVDVTEIEKVCDIHEVFIINDFLAVAYGIDELIEKDVVTLQKGKHNLQGNRLVVGAGTGLGVAPVINCDGEFIPQASEGGHLDFAPLNPCQIDLLSWLHQKWHHVSYERILSGEGIESLYMFFSQRAQEQDRKDFKQSITAAEIHALALNGDDIAVQTLDTFVEVYGAYIGNLGLVWKSTAGIYIAGGIATKIQDWMEKPIFIKALLNKGRMEQQVKDLPVFLVKNQQLGLLGCLVYVRSKV